MSVEERGLASVSELSDEDRVINYCLQNKVSQRAIDELLKLGFTSLEALRLVDMSDLVGPKIPKGQRCLILHIAEALGDPTNNQSMGGTITDGTAVCHPSAEDTVTSRFTANITDTSSAPVTTGATTSALTNEQADL